MIYGQSIYIYKSSRMCFILVGALSYVLWMHFFKQFAMVITHNGDSRMFSPMSFGIGDIILIIGCICIPKIISFITRNYFENPVRCKKVKRYTYYSLWLSTIIIYTLMEDFFIKHVMVIPFSNTILILIYLTIISLVLYFLIRLLEEGKSEDKKEKSEQKYFDALNKQYEKHVKKRQRHSKTPLDFNKFKKQRAKVNSFAIIMFSAYSIMFLILAIIVGRGMLIHGNIDAVGIILLIIISFFDVVMVLGVTGFIQINKKLII